MASRIFWFLVAGLALVGGIIWQEGVGIISWDDQDGVAVKAEEQVERQIERAVDKGIEKMTVVGADGEEIDVPVEAKRALAEAIGRLASAQADLVMLRVRDARTEEIQAATVRRDEARADADRLKEVIKRHDQALTTEDAAVREQIRQEVRQDVREAVREAVRN